MGNLTGRIAIVTGASRRMGIGSAIYQALAKEGADIYFTYWGAYDRSMEWGEDQNWTEQLTGILQNEGVRVASMEIDLADANSPQRIMDEVISVFGTPSILINNAAYSTRDGYQHLDAKTLDAHYAVNVRGTCLLCVEFARRFNLPLGGRIVNMISGQDKGPMPGELAYVATKGAISAFTVTLAAEVASLHITVNAVDPGPTNTGWMNEEVQQLLLPKFPLKRIGQPEDVDRLIKFLVTDEGGMDYRTNHPFGRWVLGLIEAYCRNFRYSLLKI